MLVPMLHREPNHYVDRVELLHPTIILFSNKIEFLSFEGKISLERLTSIYESNNRILRKQNVSRLRRLYLAHLSHHSFAGEQPVPNSVHSHPAKAEIQNSKRNNRRRFSYWMTIGNFLRCPSTIT